MPKFSVAIPAYNRPEFLHQAIGSCLNQSLGDLEVIVSDDCSSDDLASVARSFRDDRVKYHRSDVRLRATRNHQAAVARCIGTYVLTLNSDDLLLPTCLAVSGAALDARDDAAAVYFSATYLLGSRIEGFQPVPRLPFADRDALAANPWLEKFHGTTPSCCLFRRRAFDALGGYRTSLRLAYDWDLYMRFMTRGGGVVFLSRILSVYRKHAEQMVQTSSLDGLRDILDLWREPEYSHWPASDIAGSVVALAATAVRASESIRPVLAEVRQRGLTTKVLAGVPSAVARRLLARMRPPTALDRNYETPFDADSVVQSAPRALGFGFTAL